ncbi:HEAT repeat domain-containing protein [bacterium]|nr:HEAT repeat domain-containing protein [bacterium]
MKLLTIFTVFLLTFPLFSQEILEMLNSSDLMQKKLGIRQAISKKDLEPKIIELFHSDSNLEIQMEAARTLGVYKTDTALNALLDKLPKTDSEELQSYIVQALSNYLSKKEAENAIISILQKGKTEFTRSIAAQTLSKSSSEESLNALIEALTDDSSVVRKKVVNTLGELGNKKSIPALEKVKKDDPDAETRSYALSALKKMGVEDESLKSTSTALILGLTPINGLGLWYADHKALAIVNFILEGAAIGMIVYGWDGINDTNQSNELVDPGKHWTGIAGFSLLIASYLFDVIYPVMSVSKFNEKQESKTVFKPIFFTNGEATVFGFSLNF